MHPFSDDAIGDSIKRVIERVRKGTEEGYVGPAEELVYEVNTSGWLSYEEGDLERWLYTPTNHSGDVKAVETWRLASRGHQKVMLYMYQRLCRHLSMHLETECAFLEELG